MFNFFVNYFFQLPPSLIEVPQRCMNDFVAALIKYEVGLTLYAIAFAMLPNNSNENKDIGVCIGLLTLDNLKLMKV